MHCSLCIMPIPHRTTTILKAMLYPSRLFFIPLLHRTTTSVRLWAIFHGLFLILLLHRTTTADLLVSEVDELFLILLLHRTTTSGRLTSTSPSCSLFSFYIEPQRIYSPFQIFQVVPYSPSTSNHNRNISSTIRWSLFLILLLHRTTT